MVETILCLECYSDKWKELMNIVHLPLYCQGVVLETLRLPFMPSANVRVTPCAVITLHVIVHVNVHEKSKLRLTYRELLWLDNTVVSKRLQWKQKEGYFCRTSLWDTSATFLSLVWKHIVKHTCEGIPINWLGGANKDNLLRMSITRAMCCKVSGHLNEGILWSCTRKRQGTT